MRAPSSFRPALAHAFRPAQAPTKTISYGFAVHNFAPVLEGTKEGEEEGNPFQVSAGARAGEGWGVGDGSRRRQECWTKGRCSGRRWRAGGWGAEAGAGGGAVVLL